MAMKIRIEIEPQLSENEVIFRCSEINEDVLYMQKIISEYMTETKSLILRKQGTEYFIAMEEIVFFETDSKVVFAHTNTNVYETEYKLYELEGMLPVYFMRVSKSTIVNTKKIFSITRNLTASSVIHFADTPKQTYVSRQYYKILMEKMREQRQSALSGRTVKSVEGNGGIRNEEKL